MGSVVFFVLFSSSFLWLAGTLWWALKGVAYRGREGDDRVLQERGSVFPMCRRGGGGLRVRLQASTRTSPRLRGSVRFVCVARKALRLNVKRRLCRVRRKSLTIVFPSIVRRCRIFSPKRGGTICL